MYGWACERPGAAGTARLAVAHCDLAAHFKITKAAWSQRVTQLQDCGIAISRRPLVLDLGALDALLARDRPLRAVLPGSPVQQLLAAVEDPALFSTDPAAGTARLATTREDLARCFGITSTALSRRISTLRRHSVVVAADPLTLDLAALHRRAGRTATPAPASQGAAPIPSVLDVGQPVSAVEPSFDVGVLLQNLQSLGFSVQQLMEVPTTTALAAEDVHRETLTPHRETLTVHRETLTPHRETLTPGPVAETAPVSVRHQAGPATTAPARVRDFRRWPCNLTVAEVHAMTIHWPGTDSALLHSVLRAYPPAWAQRAVMLVDAAVAAGYDIRRRPQFLYRAALEGYTAYFPLEAPQQCGHCTAGIIIDGSAMYSSCSQHGRSVEAATRRSQRSESSRRPRVADIEALDGDDAVAAGYTRHGPHRRYTAAGSACGRCGEPCANFGGGVDPYCWGCRQQARDSVNAPPPVEELPDHVPHGVPFAPDEHAQYAAQVRRIIGPDPSPPA